MEWQSKNKIINSLAGTLSLLLLVILSGAVLPDTKPSDRTAIRFEKISVDDGLSQSTVFSVCQDSKGYMWFGTLEGLNRYDGYNFTVFKANQYKSGSLASSTIFRIYEDRHSNLWLGTLGGGLNRFNRDRENFTAWLHNPSDPGSLSNNNVRAIFEDSRGNLWIGTNNGLNLFNPSSGKFQRFYSVPGDSGSLSSSYIWSVFEDNQHRLWIGTYGGLNKYNYATGKFKRFVHDPADGKSLSNNYVWDIFQDHKGRLWIGTNNGLNLFNPLKGTFKIFRNEQGNPNSISQNNIWKIFEDKTGRLWVGTLGGGLNLISEIGEEKFVFTRFQSTPYDAGSLSHNYVWSMYEDRSGVLWIGTDIGLNKYDSKKEKFRHFKNDPHNPNSLTHNEVTSIYVDAGNTVWIGTRNGLDMYEPWSGNFKHYKNKPGISGSLSNNYIRALYEDREGKLWIGTNGGGLNILDRKTGRFSQFKVGPGKGPISDNDVTAIFEDKTGVMWIGTLAGLNKYDRKTGKFTVYLSDPSNPSSLSHDYVYSICEDASGYLWIGTLGGGLNRFDPVKGEFRRIQNQPGNPNSLSNNYVWTIFQDPAVSPGILWIGTNDGLNRYDIRKNQFTVYNAKDGFVNNVIYGILDDSRKNLWLSTNKGLIRFNPADGSLRTYTVGDGLQSSQFNGGAFFKTVKQEMFFGGINGFNSFFPDSIRDNSFIPPIEITDFLIFNRSVKNDDTFGLNKSLTESGAITLKYDQSVFSIEFAALHYSNPGGNKYAYRLEGFDKDWNYCQTRRYVTYTNLDPGVYIFRVIGSNNDGVWNTKGASVRIEVLPPYWKTWWFQLIIVLAILGFIWSAFAIRMRYLLDIERLRLKISADLHDDIGTRLTEISMLSDIASSIECEKGSGEIKETVKKIGGIARSLIDNMSDIIWLINPKKDSLYELFLKLRDSYEEIFYHSQILFHIDDMEFLEQIKLPIEYRKHLYLIFKEALNNSLKYSRCSEISIRAKLNGRMLEITLNDNGTGFDPQKPQSGNGLGNMKTRAEMIKGNLTIISGKGGGTVIKFSGHI